MERSRLGFLEGQNELFNMDILIEKFTLPLKKCLTDISPFLSISKEMERIFLHMSVTIVTPTY
jgi:hypothetical protein